jgi:3-hydroxyacyl-[acyl-carrier-protein] dehydratase
MLLNNLYFVRSRQVSNNAVNALIVFNEDHDIFKGHFPGQPVVPGVCMIQVIRELTEAATNLRLCIPEADNIKFLSVIDPRENKNIQVDISYSKIADEFEILATMLSGPVTYFKFKGIFRKALNGTA